MIHKLLARQIELCELDESSLPTDLDQWKRFLERVGKVYADNEQDRYLLERSLQISSQEMLDRWQALDLEKAKSVHSSKFATLGEMAGSIAHEINNPIGLITVLTGQLLEMAEDKSLNHDELIESLKQIEESAWRAAKIIKGLRGFSRDGSKDLFSSVSIKKIVDDTLVFCSERFRQNDVALKVDNPDVDRVVDCREVEICQVLLNLLNNSFDALQANKEKWIHLEVREVGKHIEFSVVDSGKKIPDEVSEKFFQPFFTTKEIGKGTGLGLSISKKIAEDHGGTLAYDKSSPHVRFVFTIEKKHSTGSASK